MKAMQVVRRGESAGLEEVDLPRPEPGPGEVLVRVSAAGVTTAELEWYPTTHLRDGRERVGAVPGHEFAGVVEAVGSGVDTFAVGEEVFGMNDWFDQGATAEFCVTKPEWIASKPKSLTVEEAAVTPISALTAWQGVMTHGKLSAGERVLVLGGSGAVGMCAVQMAKRAEACVIATASGAMREILLKLGADEVIDYKTERFEDQVQDIDLVFDTVGGESLEHAWDVLSPKGRVVTVATNAEGSESGRTKEAFFIVEPDRKQLEDVGKLIDKGSLQIFVKAVVPMRDAEEAYCGSVEGALAFGKLVISVSEQSL